MNRLVTACLHIPTGQADLRFQMTGSTEHLLNDLAFSGSRNAIERLGLTLKYAECCLITILNL